MREAFRSIAKRFEDIVLLVVGPNKFGTREKMESILSSEDLLEQDGVYRFAYR